VRTHYRRVRRGRFGACLDFIGETRLDWRGGTGLDRRGAGAHWLGIARLDWRRIPGFDLRWTASCRTVCPDGEKQAWNGRDNTFHVLPHE